jgi:hypothetical protein
VLFLRHSLAPQIRAKEPDLDKPALLLYDGHGSHVSDEFVDEASKWNIRVYCLPAHTTHKLQPLDVAVFAPVKRAWLTRTTQASVEGAEMPREDLVNEYLQVREAAMEESVVRYAWEASGLVPLNPDVFTEADFAPAQASSYLTYLPVSFTSELTSVWTQTFFYESSSLVGEASSTSFPRPHFHDELEEDDNMDIDIEHGILHNDEIPLESPLLPTSVASTPGPSSQTSPQSSLQLSSSPSISPPTTSSEFPTVESWSVPLVKRPRLPLSWPLERKLLVVEKYSRELENVAQRESELLQTAVAQRDALAIELRLLQAQHQAEVNACKRPRRQFKHQAGWLNSAENEVLRSARKAKEAEEAANKAAEAARKSTEEQEQVERRRRLCNDLTVRYTGKLVPANYNKARLQDVASLLDIPFTPKDTMPVLVTAIKACISSSLTLQEDPRFKNLDWDDSGRRRKRRGRRSACKAPALLSDNEDEPEPGFALSDDDLPTSGELILTISLLSSSCLT